MEDLLKTNESAEEAWVNTNLDIKFTNAGIDPPRKPDGTLADVVLLLEAYTSAEASAHEKLISLTLVRSLNSAADTFLATIHKSAHDFIAKSDTDMLRGSAIQGFAYIHDLGSEIISPHLAPTFTRFAPIDKVHADVTDSFADIPSESQNFTAEDAVEFVNGLHKLEDRVTYVIGEFQALPTPPNFDQVLDEYAATVGQSAFSVKEVFAQDWRIEDNNHTNQLPHNLLYFYTIIGIKTYASKFAGYLVSTPSAPSHVMQIKDQILRIDDPDTKQLLFMSLDNGVQAAPFVGMLYDDMTEIYSPVFNRVLHTLHTKVATIANEGMSDLLEELATTIRSMINGVDSDSKLGDNFPELVALIVDVGTRVAFPTIVATTSVHIPTNSSVVDLVTRVINGLAAPRPQIFSEDSGISGMNVGPPVAPPAVVPEPAEPEPVIESVVPMPAPPVPGPVMPIEDLPIEHVDTINALLAKAEQHIVDANSAVDSILGSHTAPTSPVATLDDVNAKVTLSRGSSDTATEILASEPVQQYIVTGTDVAIKARIAAITESVAALRTRENTVREEWIQQILLKAAAELAKAEDVFTFVNNKQRAVIGTIESLQDVGISVDMAMQQINKIHQEIADIYTSLITVGPYITDATNVIVAAGVNAIPETAEFRDDISKAVADISTNNSTILNLNLRLRNALLQKLNTELTHLVESSPTDYTAQQLEDRVNLLESYVTSVDDRVADVLPPYTPPQNTRAAAYTAFKDAGDALRTTCLQLIVKLREKIRLMKVTALGPAHGPAFPPDVGLPRADLLEDELRRVTPTPTLPPTPTPSTPRPLIEIQPPVRYDRPPGPLPPQPPLPIERPIPSPYVSPKPAQPSVVPISPAEQLYRSAREINGRATVPGQGYNKYLEWYVQLSRIGVQIESSGDPKANTYNRDIDAWRHSLLRWLIDNRNLSQVYIDIVSEMQGLLRRMRQDYTNAKTTTDIRTIRDLFTNATSLYSQLKGFGQRLIDQQSYYRKALLDVDQLVDEIIGDGEDITHTADTLMTEFGTLVKRAIAATKDARSARSTPATPVTSVTSATSATPILRQGEFVPWNLEVDRDAIQVWNAFSHMRTTNDESILQTLMTTEDSQLPRQLMAAKKELPRLFNAPIQSWDIKQRLKKLQTFVVNAVLSVFGIVDAPKDMPSDSPAVQRFESSSVARPLLKGRHISTEWFNHAEAFRKNLAEIEKIAGVQRGGVTHRKHRSRYPGVRDSHNRHNRHNSHGKQTSKQRKYSKTAKIRHTQHNKSRSRSRKRMMKY